MKTVKGIMVKVDNFGGFDTNFRPECVRFENDKLHSLIIRKPTEFYRYIGGKRFIVYADIDNLKNRYGTVLTLAIMENGILTSDRLFGDLFICNVGKKNQPKSITKADEKLILSHIIEEYFDYCPTRFIKSEYKGDQR